MKFKQPLRYAQELKKWFADGKVGQIGQIRKKINIITTSIQKVEKSSTDEIMQTEKKLKTE